jgi:hypothetical protein
MVLILISVTAGAMLVAILIIRQYLPFGNYARDGIAREDLAIARERTEQAKVTIPARQFLVVVLPDGKVVNPRVGDQL